MPAALGNAFWVANVAESWHLAASEMQTAGVHVQLKCALVFLRSVMALFSGESEGGKGDMGELLATCRAWSIRGAQKCEEARRCVEGGEEILSFFDNGLRYL